MHKFTNFSGVFPGPPLPSPGKGAPNAGRGRKAEGKKGRRKGEGEKNDRGEHMEYQSPDLKFLATLLDDTNYHISIDVIAANFISCVD